MVPSSALSGREGKHRQHLRCHQEGSRKYRGTSRTRAPRDQRPGSEPRRPRKLNERNSGTDKACRGRIHRMASGKRVGYAVVGLGSISQVAVLPAFAHSRKAKLVGVVSGDKAKAAKYAQQFGASRAYSYDEFSQYLENPQVQAVYIATPPGEHEKYAIASARAGKGS